MEKSDKLIMRKISKNFCEVDYWIFYYSIKGISAKSLRNALVKSLRNACEKIVYSIFQVLSLEML